MAYFTGSSREKLLSYSAQAACCSTSSTAFLPIFACLPLPPPGPCVPNLAFKLQVPKLFRLSPVKKGGSLSKQQLRQQQEADETLAQGRTWLETAQLLSSSPSSPANTSVTGTAICPWSFVATKLLSNSPASVHVMP